MLDFITMRIISKPRTKASMYVGFFLTLLLLFIFSSCKLLIIIMRTVIIQTVLVDNSQNL